MGQYVLDVMKLIACIPARGGSKRIERKNMRLLAGQPLIDYTLAQVQVCRELFSEVWVSTDDQEIANHCWRYPLRLDVHMIGAPAHQDGSRDIDWLKPLLQLRTDAKRRPDAYMILRPTSPFRTPQQIKAAWQELQNDGAAVDSLRAIRPVHEHPGKMWLYPNPAMPLKPYVDQKHADGTPWHSSPTQSLPQLWVQTSSLEVGWTSNVEVHGTISGRKIGGIPITDETGLSVDTYDDWLVAEAYLSAHLARLQA